MNKIVKAFLFRKSIFIFASGVFFTGCQTLDQPPDRVDTGETEAKPLAFAWPFLEPEKMVSRGGSSKGSTVTLAKEADKRWDLLQEKGLTTFERDRFAILAMEGNYRTSFQFVETAGFTKDYSPPKPYFSWGTEHVSVIEDTHTYISLQHTLVMYFENETGDIMGPMVMKHWRQDWTYQDTDLHVYSGDNTWERKRLDEAAVKGTWSQAVFQVDDSPRYEVVGRWKHGQMYSAWASETSLRPLPRREYSVRSDYNILEGEHRITIVPNGWIHEQHNRKSMKSDNTYFYVAQEVGLDRYERITDPDLSAAQESWNKTKHYWKAVRDSWKVVFASHDTFQIKADYQDQKLYEIHFSHASEIESQDSYDAEKWEQLVQDTITQFVQTDVEEATTSKY
ncbi:MAG: hypothetical protein O3C43_10490 [Verrucomicrobia bacterium]|nr:hypothetical protein [Verrucomicrobiota bacterium]MDA1066920.1 hypothetical protein [Verrucomicrobiota bacterium]